MMPTWPRPGQGWGQAGRTEVTPSLSVEARRPSRFPPALEPGGAKGCFPRRPSPRSALPPAASLGSCLLQESPSKMASGSFLSALTPTPGL